VTEAAARASAAAGGAACPPARHPLWHRRFLADEGLDAAVSFYVNEVLGVGSAEPPNPPRECRGGILADAMGLGKTVMLIALIARSQEVGDTVSPDGKTGGGTLVVCPLSLISQWEHEIQTKSGLSHFVHYGGSRAKAAVLMGADVVVTSYGTVQAEYLSSKKDGPSHAPAGLLGISWDRVILDEAHFVKNPATALSKSCCRIEAARRWAVTGTPIQNSLQDAFGLLKFLKHEPWCEPAFWKAAIADLVAGDGGPEKRRPGRRDGAADGAGLGEAVSRVKTILSPLLLRRTKDTTDETGRPILDLPPVETSVVTVKFTEPERAFYDALFEKSAAIFRGHLRAGTASKAWMSIFSLLQRLRQACDHVSLTVQLKDGGDGDGGTGRGQAEEGPDDGIDSGVGKVSDKFVRELVDKFCQNETSSDREDGMRTTFAKKVAQSLNESIVAKSQCVADECPLCLECPSIENPNVVYTPCAHMFCKECLLGLVREQQGHLGLSALKKCSVECPVCKGKFCLTDVILIKKSEGEMVSSYIDISDIRNLGKKADDSSASHKSQEEARDFLQKSLCGAPSSKLTSIVSSLDEIWKLDPGTNVVVFSQYLGFLDLLGSSLLQKNIENYRLDGKLSLKQRYEVLDRFASSRDRRRAASRAPGDGPDGNVARGSVLLISMRAGGVGLNLVSASAVFIADPWWNAAVEDQCISRIHRLGQTAPLVRVRKFIVEDSVEERIVQVQLRKKDVANDLLKDQGSVNEASGGSATLNDFKLLFRSN